MMAPSKSTKYSNPPAGLPCLVFHIRLLFLRPTRPFQFTLISNQLLQFIPATIISTMASPQSRPSEAASSPSDFSLSRRASDSSVSSPPPEADPAVIVGLACRVPGAQNPSQLWKNIETQKDLRKKMPPDRFNIDAFYHPDGANKGTVRSLEVIHSGDFLADSILDQLQVWLFPRPGHWGIRCWLLSYLREGS